MPEVLTIDLKDSIQGGASLQFLRAEVPDIEDPPVALIRYTLDGEQEPTGLRLDLDKQVFLDHFEAGSPKEEVLQQVAPQILKLVYTELEAREGLSPVVGLTKGDDAFAFEDDSPIVELPGQR